MKKLIILIVFLLILGTGVVYCIDLLKSGVININQGLNVLAPTGDIDDTVDTLLGESDDESAVIGDGQTDKDLITSDGQQVSDFGQSADENEF